jgi:hypothetical protein
MGWLYLGQDRSMKIWDGCIEVRMWVYKYGLAECRSEYECNGMDWLYLG